MPEKRDLRWGQPGHGKGVKGESTKFPIKECRFYGPLLLKNYKIWGKKGKRTKKAKGSLWMAGRQDFTGPGKTEKRLGKKKKGGGGGKKEVASGRQPIGGRYL